jgi:hypothetical protein
VIIPHILADSPGGRAELGRRDRARVALTKELTIDEGFSFVASAALSI